VRKQKEKLFRDKLWRLERNFIVILIDYFSILCSSQQPTAAATINGKTFSSSLVPICRFASTYVSGHLYKQTVVVRCQYLFLRRQEHRIRHSGIQAGKQAGKTTE